MRAPCAAMEKRPREVGGNLLQKQTHSPNPWIWEVNEPWDVQLISKDLAQKSYDWLPWMRQSTPGSEG